MIRHPLSPLSPVFTGSQDDGSCARSSAAQGRAWSIPGWGQPLTQQDVEGCCGCVPASYLQESFSHLGWVVQPSGLSLQMAGHFSGLPGSTGSFVGKTFLAALFAAGVAMAMLPGWQRREEALTFPWEGSPVLWYLAAFQVRDRTCNRSCFRGGTSC